MTPHVHDLLVVIPARAGSKGITNKNTRPFANGPSLVERAIAQARTIAPDLHICLSTDDPEARHQAQNLGLPVPFLREAHLATDTAPMHDVLVDALLRYQTLRQQTYPLLLLLQPTAPLRQPYHIAEAVQLLRDTPEADMVVSVCEATDNPYYTLTEEDPHGWLHRSKPSAYTRRQDCPPVYRYNGAVYVLRTQALLHTPLHQLKHVRKYLMPASTSIDLDTPLDWAFAEYLLQQNPAIPT